MWRNVWLIPFLILCGCKHEVKHPEGLPLGVEEVLTDFTVIKTSSGIRSWTLHATRGVRVRDTFKVYGVELQLYDEDGKFSATMVADSAVFLELDSLLFAYGEIVLEAPAETVRVETHYVRWEISQNLIVAPGKVEIWKADRYMEGEWLTTDSKFRDLRLRKVYGRMD